MERLADKLQKIINEQDFCFTHEEIKIVIKALKRLDTYEDAEEQGLLLRLPCKVGDKVFYVDSIRKFVDECEIRRIKCESLDERHMGITLEMIGSLWHCVRAELIGNDIFLTKEEAEQALAERKNDE